MAKKSGRGRPDNFDLGEELARGHDQQIVGARVIRNVSPPPRPGNRSRIDGQAPEGPTG